jgi:hypothetical protein
MTTMGPTVSVFRCFHTSSSGLRPADRAADKRAGAFPSGFRQKFLFSSRCVRVRDQRSKRSRAWPRRSGDQENLRSQTPIGLRNQEFDDHFVNLYGNDYPSMKLIYPALRGGVESGPEEPIEAAPQRFFLLTVGSIGSGMIQLRSIEAFAQSKLADEGYCYVVCGGPDRALFAEFGGGGLALHLQQALAQ